jgi:hypothetical protein
MTNICTRRACGQPRPSSSYLCRDCAARLDATLKSVPGLHAELLVTVARLDVLGGNTRKSSDPPMPYRAAAAEAAWVLVTTYFAWAGHYRDTLGLPLDWPPAQWLARHVGDIAGQPDAADALDEIGSAVALAYRAIDRPPTLMLAGVCNTRTLDGGPPCEAMLYATPGATRSQCRACGAIHDVGERRQWMLDAAGDLLVTHTVALGWVRLLMGEQIPNGTWRSWLSRGNVIAHAVDQHGRPLYRFGDVRALANSRVARKH